MQKSLKAEKEKMLQLNLGKDLFLKGFDKQVDWCKKNDTKKVESTLPAKSSKKRT